MTNKKLKNSLRKFKDKKEDKLVVLSGNLGIPLRGSKVVEVPGRAGFVFVRIKGNTSELIQAYNSSVSTIYGLPVLVARKGNVYHVIGRNIERYQDWGKSSYLPKHGSQHSFNHELGMGGDVSWIYSQQFMPMLSYPSGSAGGMTLSIFPHFYEWEGSWRYLQITGTPSYTPYLPTAPGTARMVLSYVDPLSNGIRLVAGTPFSDSLTGSAQIAQYIPDIPRSVGIPLAAVRLVTGTPAIGWGNIYDVRDFYTTFVSSSGTSQFPGIVGQDEGIPIGTGTVLNVVGNGATLTISGGVLNLNVPGGGGGSNGFAGMDEGIPLGTGTILNVVGEGATLSLSGTIFNLNVPLFSGSARDFPYTRNVNHEILGGTRVLTTSDVQIQTFQPSGTDRNVRLPAPATGTFAFLIQNEGSFRLTINDASGFVNYYTLGVEQGALCVPHLNGVGWTVIPKIEFARDVPLIDTGNYFTGSHVEAALQQLGGYSQSFIVGHQPYAYQEGYDNAGTIAATQSLAANGGSIAIPMRLVAPMQLASVSIRNWNTATQRTWGWDLYIQDTNTGNPSEGVVRRVAASNGNDTFTPGGAASTRTLDASGAPVWLQPGVYWLVIQCRHATNNIGIGTVAANAFGLTMAKTQTTPNPNGSTINLVTGTWTAVTYTTLARLDGWILGKTGTY